MIRGKMMFPESSRDWSSGSKDRVGKNPAIEADRTVSVQKSVSNPNSMSDGAQRGDTNGSVGDTMDGVSEWLRKQAEKADANKQSKRRAGRSGAKAKKKGSFIGFLFKLGLIVGLAWWFFGTDTMLGFIEEAWYFIIDELLPWLEEQLQA